MKAECVFVFLLLLVLFSGCVEQQANNRLALETAEAKAVAFLEESQLPSGEFAAYASFSKDMENSIYNKSPFITSFVVHSLNFAEQTEEVRGMKRKGVEFIASQKSEGNTWNFWGLNEEGIYPKAPDDLDVTSCAVASLKENGKNIEIDFEEYRAENGGYFTWMIEKEKDVDCVVNANILFFYGLQKREDTKLCRYMNALLKNQDYADCTEYYSVSPYAFPYAISRAFADADTYCIKDSLHYIQSFLLEKQENGSWGNDLDNALATVSLINIGFEGKELDEAIANIINRQNPDGSWEKEAFFIWDKSVFFTDHEDYQNPNNIVYFSSEELTTATSLEAIAKYRNIKQGR